MVSLAKASEEGEIVPVALIWKSRVRVAASPGVLGLISIPLIISACPLGVGSALSVLAVNVSLTV